MLGRSWVGSGPAYASEEAPALEKRACNGSKTKPGIGFLNNNRSTARAQHGFEGVMSSLGPQIQARAALGVYFSCPLNNAWPAEASPLASKQLSARLQRGLGRPRWSDPISAFV